MQQNYNLLWLHTPPRQPASSRDPQVSQRSDSSDSEESENILSVNMDFKKRRETALKKYKDGLATDNATQIAEAEADLEAIAAEEVEAAKKAEKEAVKAEKVRLKQLYDGEQQARTEAYAQLMLEKTRVRELEETLKGGRGGARRTIMGMSSIMDNDDGTSAGANPPPNTSGISSAAGNQQPAAPTQRAAVHHSTATEREIYQELERMNISPLGGLDTQATILMNRPGLMHNPGPNDYYNMTHGLEGQSLREDLRQEKIMLQKVIQGYFKFTADDTAVTWDMFEIQMDGLVSQGMYKEGQLAILLWSLVGGGAQVHLMSKGVFQGSSFTVMYECLKQAYQRKPSAVLQDMAACTQGPGETVLDYTARFRILAASTFPKQVPMHRVISDTLVPNPFYQAEKIQYQAFEERATAVAQHHFVKGLRQDIRRKMSTLHFTRLDDAVTAAQNAEETLQALGEIRSQPNPLVKPQINMMQGKGFKPRRGKGQSQGQGQGQGQGQNKKFEGECFICHKYGHRASDCWQNKQKSGSNSRSQQDENAHVQGAMNAVKGQVNNRSSSNGSHASSRGRSGSPRGRSPQNYKSNSGSSAQRGKQSRQGRGGSRNRDKVSFSNNHSNSGSGPGGNQRRGKFNALHGEQHYEEEPDYES